MNQAAEGRETERIQQIQSSIETVTQTLRQREAEVEELKRSLAGLQSELATLTNQGEPRTTTITASRPAGQNVEENKSNLADCLRSIKKADLDEVKALKNPPSKIRLVLDLVYGILHKKKSQPTWQEARAMLGDSTFLSNLISLDPNTVPEDVKRWTREQINAQGLDVESVQKVSRCAANLSAWLIAASA
eukprot:TRINITY_DN13103_c0_g1_i3.p1 TRINITY_DN13103_c0_g1~~TRINITY_DN13103_c0_g1_i3.p1  ORF type:complete len:190 (-),score=24.20 TRINITY_DN13103_c0_g1_i3:162-731(-)